MPRAKMNPMAKLARRCAELADLEVELERQQIEAGEERERLQKELAGLLALNCEDAIDSNTQITIQARKDMVIEVDFTAWVNSDKSLEDNDSVSFFYQPVETW